ncbi:Hypothetical protein FKW44_021524, partial [Caligus rogercresseyi]
VTYRGGLSLLARILPLIYQKLIVDLTVHPDQEWRAVFTSSPGYFLLMFFTNGKLRDLHLVDNTKDPLDWHPSLFILFNGRH